MSTETDENAELQEDWSDDEKQIYQRNKNDKDLPEIAKIMREQCVFEAEAREILAKRNQQPQPDTARTEALEQQVQEQNANIENLKTSRNELLKKSDILMHKLKSISMKTSGLSYIHSRNLVKLSDDYIEVLAVQEELQKKIDQLGADTTLKQNMEEINKKIEVLTQKITAKKQKTKGYVKKISDAESREFSEE